MGCAAGMAGGVVEGEATGVPVATGRGVVAPADAGEDDGAGVGLRAGRGVPAIKGGGVRRTNGPGVIPAEDGLAEGVGVRSADGLVLARGLRIFCVMASRDERSSPRGGGTESSGSMTSASGTALGLVTTLSFSSVSISRTREERPS